MTEIQSKILKKLEYLSEELKIPIRDLSEKNNAYVSGLISDYKFWLYEDGEASFSSEYYDRRFEKYDFKDEDDLINNFIDTLKEGILRRDYFRAHPSKSPLPLFNRLIDWFKDVLDYFNNEKK